jgi:predicted DNA-binding ribbon-helix-helix protein
MKSKSLVLKRSIIIGGHKTSVSLEDVFWNALRDIAQERDETLSKLVASIDANRKAANLSSALRVYVVRFYMDQSARQRELFKQRAITVQ